MLDLFGTPEFRDGEVLIPIAEEAFICQTCGKEHPDRTSTWYMYAGGVYCDDCIEKAGGSKPRCAG